MKKIIVIFLTAVLLAACSANEPSSTDNKAFTEPKKVVKKTETAKSSSQPSPSEVDEHHGHNHAADNGEAYETLANPFATENPNKVVVYEFFGYPCGHCYDFEPQMARWMLDMPDYVEVIKVPLNFNRGWGVMQLGYITAKSMGIADANHRKLFQAIHEKNTRFNTIDDLAQWYADNSNVSKDDFLSTAESFIIDSNVRKADKMGVQMQVTSTPTIVVNGKYKPKGKLKNREDLFETMDQLIEKEAKQMGITGSN